MICEDNSVTNIATIFQNELIPNFLNTISGSQKIEHWKNFFNTLLPKSSLGYESEETYLSERNLSIDSVIKNSINQVFCDLPSDEISDLINFLTPLSKDCRIRELVENQTAVYTEIMQILTYIQRIQQLLDLYKISNSDKRGTAHRKSSLRDITKTQINKLEDRLNGSFFNIQSLEEIERTEKMLKLLKLSFNEEYKGIFEFFNLTKLLMGFDVKILGATSNEITALEQVTDFYNGIRSEPHELVRSVMIYMNQLFVKSSLDPELKAENILSITRMFFSVELSKAEKGKNKLPFTTKHIRKDHIVKTILHEVPIYTYLDPKKRNYLDELMDESFKGMMGLQNIFEPNNPSEENISWFTIGRNIIKSRKEFGLSYKGFKAMRLVLFKDDFILSDNSSTQHLLS
jgi:hypothetical protein